MTDAPVQITVILNMMEKGTLQTSLKTIEAFPKEE
jgi:hypothetical protein